MNQILYMNNPKKKGGPLELKTIFLIFAILLILFGLILAAVACVKIIKDKQENETIPVVEILPEGAMLKLKITHDKIIDKVVYSWNQNTETVLQGMGRLEIEENISMPKGTNNFVLKVTDINNKTTTYQNTYTLPEGDVTEPEIELLVEGSKIKIVAKDETEIDYITYYWNEEDETTVQVREDSPKQIEEKIDILKGENTLNIVAVDKAGNETTKEQIFKGVKKPKIALEKKDNNLIITITDEEGIQKVEYTLNGVDYSTDPQNTGKPLNRKEFKITQPLAQGENKITIRAYNISGLQEETSGEATI